MLSSLGVWPSWSLSPSNRKRTLLAASPCLWQQASMSFLSWVVDFILKKTSSPSYILILIYLTFHLEIEVLCRGWRVAWLRSFVFAHVIINYQERAGLVLIPLLTTFRASSYLQQAMHLKLQMLIIHMIEFKLYCIVITFTSIDMRLSSLGEIQQDTITWNPESNKAAHLKSEHKIDIAEVFSAHKLFVRDETITQTTITHSKQLSEMYKAQIYFKREDLQKGKTYKIRGGYYFYLKEEQKIKNEGFVAVSDGNFATSVALLASLYQFKCTIFVPYCCFEHKIEAIKNNGKEFVTIIQEGDDFEECQKLAKEYATEKNLKLIQPHASEILMPGYATIAKEIIDEKRFSDVDYIIVPSGGGALVSSIASFMKQVSPNTKVIAVEPEACTPFSNSIIKGEIVCSQKVSKFCNGSSVKRIGDPCFKIGKTCVDGFVSVTQNKLAQTIIKLYSMGIICEPSGALAVAGLNRMKNQIAGKNVVCILTGSNMDLSRLEQARQLNVISKGYKNYYIVEFPNKKKGMYDLLTKCFQKTDVLAIQYVKHANKDVNQVILAVESPCQENVQYSLNQMVELKFKVDNITDRSELLELIF